MTPACAGLRQLSSVRPVEAHRGISQRALARARWTRRPGREARREGGSCSGAGYGGGWTNCALDDAGWRAARAASSRSASTSRMGYGPGSERCGTGLRCSATSNTERPVLTTEVGPPPVDAARLPRHVAVIMDGNARWARAAGLPSTAGYEGGVRALNTAVECCVRWEISALTVFALSVDNFKRDERELGVLLSLMSRVLRGELPRLVEANVQLHFFGQIHLLPANLRGLIRESEEATSHNTGLQLCIAVGYSGREDIAAAARACALRVERGELLAADVTSEELARHLSTAALPAALGEPDLLIRTSGEQRLSDFLLWELAYTEFYFTEECWPDFGERQLRAAVVEYAARNRRYGEH